jgi:hypothetical protein
LLRYAEVRRRQRTHPLRQTEVPVEHAVSLPLPTRRWIGPGFAFFAAPASRAPDQPTVQGAPDRWWVVDAQGGALIVYALYAAIPFAPGVSWAECALPSVTHSLDDQRKALQNIEARMDAVAPDFFAGRSSDLTLRRALADALRAHLPTPLQPQYRALAPDFFAWLEA